MDKYPDKKQPITMADQIDLQTLKQTLPKYKVIDISVINDCTEWMRLVITKPNVVLVSFRSSSNSELWSFLDEFDQHQENKTGITAPSRADFKLWNKDDYLNVIISHGKEHNLRRIRSWLENDKDSCYICTEQITHYGHMCSTCFNASCLNCFNQLIKYRNDAHVKCPVCRKAF